MSLVYSRADTFASRRSRSTLGRRQRLLQPPPRPRFQRFSQPEGGLRRRRFSVTAPGHSASFAAAGFYLLATFFTCILIIRRFISVTVKSHVARSTI